jgi:hypothetical protein
MRICDHWSTDPPGLHCERSRLHFEPLELLNFHFVADADPDPPFHSNEKIMLAITISLSLRTENYGTLAQAIR